MYPLIIYQSGWIQVYKYWCAKRVPSGRGAAGGFVYEYMWDKQTFQMVEKYDGGSTAQAEVPRTLGVESVMHYEIRFRSLSGKGTIARRFRICLLILFHKSIIKWESTGPSNGGLPYIAKISDAIWPVAEVRTGEPLKIHIKPEIVFFGKNVQQVSI